MLIILFGVFITEVLLLVLIVAGVIIIKNYYKHKAYYLDTYKNTVSLESYKKNRDSEIDQLIMDADKECSKKLSADEFINESAKKITNILKEMNDYYSRPL